MADEPDNVVLLTLRRIDTKIDRIIDDVGELKTRAANLEENSAILMRRMDRFESRLERIERRLDLVEH